MPDTLIRRWLPPIDGDSFIGNNPPVEDTDGTICEKRISQISQTSTNSNKSSRQKLQVGPWRLGRTLGRGSSGRVRLARHIVTGKSAAVKILPKNIKAIHGKADEGGNSFPDSAGIEREIIIMKLIDHPSVMKLYDVWENRNELYLVLEYVEGGELFDYLVANGRLPEEEAAKFFYQIICGVDFCHRFHIFHRDLKPENLLMDKNYNIKIADFGMAALEAHDRMLETSCGSPHYAAPEVVAGKAYHGAPSDIWSCGIILFALLNGYLPFDDENIRQLLLKVKFGHFQMPSDLSGEAKDLVRRMLDVNTDTRIRMPEILAHPFLKKYESVRNLPKGSRPPSMSEIAHPVKSIAEIEPEILKSLLVLWRFKSRASMIESLLSKEPNIQKMFYCLLLKYMRKRREHYDEDIDGLAAKSQKRECRAMNKSVSRRSISSIHFHRRRGSKASRKSVSSNRHNIIFDHTRRERNGSSGQMITDKNHQQSVYNSNTDYTKDVENRGPAKITSKKPTINRGCKGPRMPFASIEVNVDDRTCRTISQELAAEIDDAFSTPRKHRPKINLLHPVVEDSNEALYDTKIANMQKKDKSACFKERGIDFSADHKHEISPDERFADADEESLSQNFLRKPEVQARSRPASEALNRETPSRVSDRRYFSVPVRSEAIHMSRSITNALEYEQWMQPNSPESLFYRPVPPDLPEKDFATPEAISLNLNSKYGVSQNTHSWIDDAGDIKLSFFSRLLRVKPLSRTLQARCSETQLRICLWKLLQKMEEMNIGLTITSMNSEKGIFKVTIKKKNAARLKFLKFRIRTVEKGLESSIIKFQQEKGAGSTFTPVVNHISKVLNSEGVLVS